MSQYHFDPETYLTEIRGDIADFDAFQDRVAAATQGVKAARILELGIGTGETARRVLALHPGAELVAVDESEEMIDVARAAVGGNLSVARLQDDLPAGSFDLVVAALSVHHLDAGEKQDLFRRIARSLRPGGRFVLGDVVVPDRPEDATIPLTPDFDRPDRLEDQLAWLREAGFDAESVWSDRDLGVVRADLRG
jgi:tRNA (cmo5U34)-methyltransferase